MVGREYTVSCLPNVRDGVRGIGRIRTGWWVGKNGVTVTRRCQPRREANRVERKKRQSGRRREGDDGKTTKQGASALCRVNRVRAWLFYADSR